MTHERGKCLGEYCTIHNHSDHHMVDWPQNWRSDRGIMERMCVHGVGHPDPDDPNVIAGDSVHGCDGCCASVKEGEAVRYMTFARSVAAIGAMVGPLGFSLHEETATINTSLFGNWWPCSVPRLSIIDERGKVVDILYMGDAIFVGVNGEILIERKYDKFED